MYLLFMFSGVSIEIVELILAGPDSTHQAGSDNVQRTILICEWQYLDCLCVLSPNTLRQIGRE